MNKDARMTGRDLIVYILENHLEDVPILENGKVIGLVTAEEAAAKLQIGKASVVTLYGLGLLPGGLIGGELYILSLAVPQSKGGPDV